MFWSKLTKNTFIGQTATIHYLYNTFHKYLNKHKIYMPKILEFI